MDEEILPATPETLKMLRKRHGYTQKQLADKLGVSLSTVKKYETVRTKHGSSPIAPIMEKICELYKVTLCFGRQRKAGEDV